MNGSESVPAPYGWSASSPAPPHQVYRAWLEPELLRRWMARGISNVPGRGRRARRRPLPDLAWAGGSRPAGSRRNCWSWSRTSASCGAGVSRPAAANGPVYDSQLTVTLAATPEGGTALPPLVHTRLDDLAAVMPDVAAQVGPGWEDVLAKLAACLAGGALARRSAVRQRRKRVVQPQRGGESGERGRWPPAWLVRNGAGTAEHRLDRHGGPGFAVQARDVQALVPGRSTAVLPTASVATSPPLLRVTACGVPPTDLPGGALRQAGRKWRPGRRVVLIGLGIGLDHEPSRLAGLRNP